MESEHSWLLWPVCITMPIWNRFIRFISNDNRIHIGEPITSTSDEDIGLLYAQGQPIKAKEIIGDVFGDFSFGSILSVVKLLSPLSAETVGAARGLGANYSNGGQNKKSSVIPLFYKPQNTITGPMDKIIIPKSVNDQTDFEAELVVIIGKRAKDVSVDDALNYVAGYTLTNDLTARKNVAQGVQFGMGKSFDGWLPIGPVVVSPSIITDPQNVQLKFSLNGQIYQDGNTSDQLYNVAETVSKLSIGCTLEPGSIIATGTPGGFGAARQPQVWLKPGDDVRVWGNHGLGTLVNHMIGDTTIAKL